MDRAHPRHPAGPVQGDRRQEALARRPDRPRDPASRPGDGPLADGEHASVRGGPARLRRICQRQRLLAFLPVHAPEGDQHPQRHRADGEDPRGDPGREDDPQEPAPHHPRDRHPAEPRRHRLLRAGPLRARRRDAAGRGAEGGGPTGRRGAEGAPALPRGRAVGPCDRRLAARRETVRPQAGAGARRRHDRCAGAGRRGIGVHAREQRPLRGRAATVEPLRAEGPVAAGRRRGPP